MRRWLCLVVVTMTACGRVNFDAAGDVTGADASNATRPLCTTAFEAPAVIVELASPYDEFCPELTEDGLEIFWHDNEPSGVGGSDLWTAVRSSTTELFGPRALVANVNTSFNEGGVSLSEDGLELYFSSERNGGGQGELFVSKRADRTASFGAAQHIPELGSVEYESSPTLSGDRLTIYFGSNRSDGLGANDIWFATRPTLSSAFGAPQNLTAINNADSQNTASVTANGLSIFYEVTGGGIAPELWVATRATIAEPFSDARPLVELNLTSTDLTPSISASGERITFSSDRRATQDPFIATRVCP